MQHPEEGLIHAWLDGALSPSEASAIESHVATCAECEARAAEARGLIAASSRIVSHLDAVPGNVIPVARPRSRRWLAWGGPVGIAIAATLLLMLKGGAKKDYITNDVPVAKPTPGVVQATPTESMPVAVPPKQVEPKRVASKPAAQSVDAPALPPAGAAITKGSIASAPPVAPQVQAEDRARKAEVQDRMAEATIASAAAARSMSARAPVAAGAAAPAPVERRLQSDTLPTRAEALAYFVGCYEITRAADRNPATTKSAQPGSIQGARSAFASEELYEHFALTDESASTPGRFAIRTLDAAGRPDQLIVGAGWSLGGDRAVVRNKNGEVVVTLLKTESGARSSTVRAVPCK